LIHPTLKGFLDGCVSQSILDVQLSNRALGQLAIFSSTNGLEPLASMKILLKVYSLNSFIFSTDIPSLEQASKAYDEGLILSHQEGFLLDEEDKSEYTFPPNEEMVLVKSSQSNYKLGRKSELLSLIKHRTTKDIVEEHDKVRQQIMSSIQLAKADELADNKVSEKELVALSETISRVPKDIWEANKSEVLRLSVEQIYMWALPNSTIVFPYLHLKQAAENIEATRIAPQRSWGLSGEEFRIPKLESISNSNIWHLLRAFVFANYDREKIREVDPDDTVPRLDNDEVDRNKSLETIIIRLLELAKSPASATIRTTGLDKLENIIRNQIDFVILDNIYQRDESYKKLSISGIALTQGRRQERVSRTSSKSKKLVYDEIIIGYKLAETLSTLVKTKKFKSPESEPFAHFFLDLLRIISLKIDIEKYQLPTSFLTAPSVRLRQNLRKGPSIKTKRGDKANLYIPFSYVKASECVPMSEQTKKDLTDTGAQILKNLDLINKLSVKEASEKYDDFDKYIKRSYIIADECRKQWRREGRIPNSEDINKVYGEVGFPKLTGDQVKSFDSGEWKHFLSAIENFKLVFRDEKQNSDEQKSLKASILKVQEDKRKKRVS